MLSSRIRDRSDHNQSARDKTFAEEHRENFDCLKAHYANQQEALQCLQEQYATLSEQYEKLHAKSREIIGTLQEERDHRIAECENLKSRILRSEQSDLKQRSMNRLVRKVTDGDSSELESLKREYNKLVCSFTHLKSEYESTLVSHQRKLDEMKKEQDMEVSLLQDRLKLAESENDAVFNVHQIRTLQRCNSELEQKVHSISEELEKVRDEQRAEMSQKDQIIHEQSECLVDAQSQIKTMEVECTTLSRSLEAVKAELKQCLEQQLNLQAVLEQAHRESSHIKMKLEEDEAKHKAQLGSLHMKLTQEHQDLNKRCEDILSEKKACEAQVELLHQSVQQYETLIRSKELELHNQMQSLEQKEWEKRVSLERENTELQEKLATMERLTKLSEENSEAQHASLEERIQELTTKYMALEAEATSLRVEQEQKEEYHRKTEMELRLLKDYKTKHKRLQLEYQKLLEAKQELEKDCTKLQSMVCELELAVSDASKEVAHVTDIQQHMLNIERQAWKKEKEALLQHLSEEEVHVRELVTDIEDERSRSKKIHKHYKKKMLDLKDTAALTQAKQVKLEAEKESLRKSLDLEKMKLNNELSKFKRRENEFSALLQGDYCGSSGMVHDCLIQQQGPEEIHQSTISTVTSPHPR